MQYIKVKILPSFNTNDYAAKVQEKAPDLENNKQAFFEEMIAKMQDAGLDTSIVEAKAEAQAKEKIEQEAEEEVFAQMDASGIEAYQEIGFQRGFPEIIRYTDLDGNTINLPKHNEVHILDADPALPAWAKDNA